MLQPDRHTGDESDKKAPRTHSLLSKKILLLLMAAVSIIVLTPIAYLRYINGDYFIALINITIVIVIILSGILIAQDKGRGRTKEAKILISIFITAGIIGAAYSREQVHIYGLFPSIIVFYYLLSQRVASLFCAVAVIGSVMAIYPKVNFVDLFGILVTISLTTVFTHLLFSNYRRANEKLALLAKIDPLTMCGNRRALDETLSKAIVDQQNHEAPITLLLVDLDCFKGINDRYGHVIGDSILIELVNLVAEKSKYTGKMYRYGGEEFVIGPFDVDLANAGLLANNLRQRIEQHTFQNNISLTISIGVAEYRLAESMEAWIHRADTALYEAKITGRNKVVTEKELEFAEVNLRSMRNQYQENHINTSFA